MRKVIETFCARLGADPLLVQGAGGNISWKVDNTLWIKGSGTWLAEAASKDIFVPVDLAYLSAAILRGDFRGEAELSAPSSMRPSIETLLHALMPHPVVLHLHAVEVLAYVVRASFPENVRLRLGVDARWIAVRYHKPGADLARAVKEALVRSERTDIVMLQNHGVLIGGLDVAEVEQHLADLTSALRETPRPQVRPWTGLAPETYEWVADDGVQQLALDPELFGRLEQDWALYPDHVVFLGGQPCHYETMDEFIAERQSRAISPEVVFVKNAGVLAITGLPVAKLAQLRCYYDVIARQAPQERLNSLQPDQIAELINWDAEKYRIGLVR